MDRLQQQKIAVLQWIVVFFGGGDNIVLQRSVMTTTSIISNYSSSWVALMGAVVKKTVCFYSGSVFQDIEVILLDQWESRLPSATLAFHMSFDCRCILCRICLRMKTLGQTFQTFSCFFHTSHSHLLLIHEVQPAQPLTLFYLREHPGWF